MNDANEGAYRRAGVSPLPRSLLPDTATVGADGWLTIGGCRVDALAADARHTGVRVRRGAPAGAVPGGGGGVRAAAGDRTRPRRSCAGRWPASPTRRACSSTSPVAASCTSRWPLGCRPIGVHDARQQQERRRAADGDRRRRPQHRRRQLRRARPPGGAPRRPSRATRPTCCCAITPGVHAHTHEYIATGQDDSKFGFNLANGDASAAVERARRSPSVNLVGLHCHIGSNVFAADSFGRAAEVMAAFARTARPARARPRRRARRRLRRGRGGADDHRVGEGRARRVPGARRASRGQRRAGSGDRRRRPRSPCTRSGRSSASPASAPTSPSTAA